MKNTNRATPITQRCKSPLKMNANLVAGAGQSASGFSNLGANFKGTANPAPRKVEEEVLDPGKLPKLELPKTGEDLGLIEDEEEFEE